MYTLRSEDPVLEADWENALNEGVDRLEAEAHRRAFQGVDEPVIYQGQIQTRTDPDGTIHVVTVKRYSDFLTAFLLKAHRPSKYGIRQDAILPDRPEPMLLDARPIDLTGLSTKELAVLDGLLEKAASTSK